MARCPECVGVMEYNSNLKMMVCTSCGLTLSRTELDRTWKEIRERNIEETDEYDKKKQKKKEWLEWYQSSNKNKY
jgi:Zn-finger nucleic acid-binding protein